MDPLGVAPNVVQVESLRKWSDEAPREALDSGHFGNQDKVHAVSPFPFRPEINAKVVLWNGDITYLNTHAIVNSTNETLCDRNPLSERILSGAGYQLKDEILNKVKGCRTGDAKITKGYKLPARHVIHTVGPKYNSKYQTAAETALYSCYFKVLTLVREMKLSTVGLCAINSIRRGYPPHEGAHIALRTVRRFLENFGSSIETVVFAVDDVDFGIYELLMPLYYPRSKMEEEYALYYLPPFVGGANGEPVIPERQIRIVDKPFHAEQEDIEVSVDLAAQLESSVSVGKTAFAKMHGDLDKRKSGQHHSPRLTCDMLTAEVQRKNRYERLLRKARTEDLRSIAALRCLFHSGEDRCGRPVIMFIGQRFNFIDVDMEKAILYLIHLMDPIVQHDYVVVYFHAMTTRENHPSLNALREIYNILEYKYKKNLRAFYVVHPTFWTRIFTWWFTTFTASSLKNKVHSLGGVEYLYSVIPPDQLDIPPAIMEYDAKVNGVRYYQPTPTDATDSL